MTRRRKKIVAITPPATYLRPRKPCPKCEGDGMVDTEPVTGMDQDTGQRMTMVLTKVCGLCKGSGVAGKAARA